MTPDVQLPVIEALPAIVLAYLAGSIPAGLIITRMFGLTDPRTFGSGNIGATNVLRTGSPLAAGLTLFVDAGKGVLAVFVGAGLAGIHGAWIAGPAAFLGHLFPVWTRFRGGKGFATFLGVTLAYDMLTCAATCATWLVCAIAFRYSSLSTLAAAIIAPGVAFFSAGVETGVVLSGLSVILWIRHTANIRRLWSGEEPRIGGS